MRGACSPQVNFARSKGHSFEVFTFKTAVTADADAMVWCAAVGVVRLMVRCGAFRAQYAGLSAERARALREYVEGERFFGVPLGRTAFPFVLESGTKFRTIRHVGHAKHRAGYVIDRFFFNFGVNTTLRVRGGAMDFVTFYLSADCRPRVCLR